MAKHNSRVTQCYHLNQANFFGAAIHFPVYSLSQDFVAESLLRSPMDPSPQQVDSFRIDVMLPPPEKLILVT
jgi:hypothetical protein